MVKALADVKAKENCWEFNKCGREAGGVHVNELGVCPAAVEDRLNRIHGGSKAGRACWVVAGTLCAGELQGTFAKKYDNCRKCEFYNKVKNEESGYFELSITLLNKLRG